MTNEEAEKVLRIMCTADNECETCAGELMDKFVEAFPEYKGLADEVYGECFSIWAEEE